MEYQEVSPEYLHRVQNMILWNTKGYMKGSKGTVTPSKGPIVRTLHFFYYRLHSSCIFSPIAMRLLVSAFFQDPLISKSIFLVTSSKINPWSIHLCALDLPFACISCVTYTYLYLKPVSYHIYYRAVIPLGTDYPQFELKLHVPQQPFASPPYQSSLNNNDTTFATYQTALT